MTRKLRARLATVCVAALVIVGCAKAPPTLTPEASRAWAARPVVAALGTVQSTAIALNGVVRCDPAPPCRPVLSERNTRTVVTTVVEAVRVIRVAPDGAGATATAALDTLS